MRVCCAICGELFLTQEDVCATPCGHTFHSNCIHQWLQQSKSCPTCRAKVVSKTLNKLYFDTRSNEEETDPDALQQQVDNLKFQVKLKEQELRKCSENAATSQAQAVALREEFKEKEKVISNKDTKILALKTQLQYVERTSNEAKKLKTELKQLKEQVKLLKGVEKVLEGSAEDVQFLLNSQNGNAKDLASYCAVLKKGLSDAMEEHKKLRATERNANRKCKDAEKKAKELEEEVQNLTTSLRLLEEDTETLEKDNRSLKKKIGMLEEAIASPSDNVRSSVLHRLLGESPAPDIIRQLYNAEINNIITPEVVRKQAKKENIEEEEEEEEEGVSKKEEVIDLVSPPTKTKASSSASSKRPLSDNLNIMKGAKRYANITKQNTNQSWKERRLEGCDVGYDGMGGHHRAEEFPRPSPFLAPTATRILQKGRRKGVAGSSNKNKLTNYFQNTFED